MTSNPLIAKYEELYGKKEEPKKVEYELPVDFKTKLKELRDTSTIPLTTTPSVATSNTGITAVNPSRAFTSYEPTEDVFLDVAGKVQKGDAKVVSMHMNMEHFRKSYTFEVQVYS
jgi:hypothetical protein